MNEKFYSLSEERQNAILMAGFRVFAHNSYQKSPMQVVADDAGISKSLLFHYFENKKEFYLYLWDYACQFAIEAMTEAGCYEETDFFKMLYKGMTVKMDILRRYPDMGMFVLKAYFEKHPDVCDEIQESYSRYFDLKAKLSLKNITAKQFVFGIDLKEMFRHMYWAAEGYLLEKSKNGSLDPCKLESDFCGMIRFWKKVYGNRGEN